MELHSAQRPSYTYACIYVSSCVDTCMCIHICVGGYVCVDTYMCVYIHITSWEIDGETVETVSDFILGAPKSLQMVTAAMKLKDTCSLEGKL